MFVQPHVAEMIRSKIAEFRDQNTYEKPAWFIELNPLGILQNELTTCLMYFINLLLGGVNLQDYHREADVTIVSNLSVNVSCELNFHKFIFKILVLDSWLPTDTNFQSVSKKQYVCLIDVPSVICYLYFSGLLATHGNNNTFFLNKPSTVAIFRSKLAANAIFLTLAIY